MSALGLAVGAWLLVLLVRYLADGVVGEALAAWGGAVRWIGCGLAGAVADAARAALR